MNLGDIIEGWCSSCKLNLDVSIAAVVDDKPKQVQCRTCGNFIAYKPPVDMAKRKAAALKKLMKMQEKKKKAAEKSGDTPAINQEVEKARWKELTDPVMSWQAKPYDRHRTYQAGAFILHKQEGMGYVESSDDGELIALFKGGLVSLPHGQEREE